MLDEFKEVFFFEIWVLKFGEGQCGFLGKTPCTLVDGNLSFVGNIHPPPNFTLVNIR